MNQKIIQGCEPTELKGNDIGCILVHGFRSCPFEMREYGQFLNNAGLTVVFNLLPGHGTNPQDLLGVKWQDWLDSIESSFLNLKKKCDKIFIAGLSTGGSLALYLASKLEFNGVIALSPGLYLQNKYAKLSHILKYFWHYKNMRSGPDVSIKVESRVYSKIPVRAISELLKLFNSLAGRLESIKIPTMVIYPEKDHVVNPKSAKIIYNRISSKNKKIINLKESFHIVTLDVEKQKVFTESLKFIESICHS